MDVRASLYRAQRLVATLGYLKPAQLAYYIQRRKFPLRRVSDELSACSVRHLTVTEPIPAMNLKTGNGSFRFLNVSIAESQNTDWNPAGVSRLWRYNLHYFDYLRQPGLSATEMAELVDSWVVNNPQGTEPGWEPFTASLRIVNWALATQLHPDLLSQAALRSLHVQARWLYQNDERHILANHYFENLKALTFAGACFEGPEPAKWLHKGTAGIRVQLSEQQLSDGGHYERSPQYHALMLENYLDLYNLAVGNSALFDADFISDLQAVAETALDWLNDIVFPDGAIPLFNDSAFEIAPGLNELNAYASRLFGYARSQPSDTTQVIDKDPSGLYGVKTPRDMIVMDCGDIGPAYQPGHTHCDFLSYELMLDGGRLVVDTGVYEYEPGEMRHYVRSTRAHNTVVIDDDEQSEIWGEFRLGRRARKLWGKVEHRGDSVQISGKFQGFFGGVWGFQPKFSVERRVELTLAEDRISSIHVVDVIDGKGQHELANYIHLHPDCWLREEGSKAIIIASNQGPTTVVLTIESDCDYEIRDTWYCPQFGIKQANKCIVITKHAWLPADMRYRIDREGAR
jgi:uncharacterized heparinase superfamily protein